MRQLLTGVGKISWLVPPVYLIPHVLVHFLNYKSRGVLVVPFWPSSLFCPYLIQGNGAYKSFVVDFLFVQNGRDVFVHGANKETCFGSSSFSNPVLFLKLDSTATSQSPLGLGSCFTVVVHWDYGMQIGPLGPFFVCSVYLDILPALIGLYLFFLLFVFYKMPELCQPLGVVLRILSSVAWQVHYLSFAQVLKRIPQLSTILELLKSLESGLQCSSDKFFACRYLFRVLTSK